MLKLPLGFPAAAAEHVQSGGDLNKLLILNDLFHEPKRHVHLELRLMETVVAKLLAGRCPPPFPGSRFFLAGQFVERDQ
jgi:hypothetical protein